MDKIAWINGKDLPDAVLMTTTDDKTSNSDEANDNSIIELLTQITRSVSKGFSCPSSAALHRIKQAYCVESPE